MFQQAYLNFCFQKQLVSTCGNTRLNINKFISSHRVHLPSICILQYMVLQKYSFFHVQRSQTHQDDVKCKELISVLHRLTTPLVSFYVKQQTFKLKIHTQYFYYMNILSQGSIVRNETKQRLLSLLSLSLHNKQTSY